MHGWTIGDALGLARPGQSVIVPPGVYTETLRLPDDVANDPTRGRISNYAWAQDYHAVMTPRLEQLATTMRSWLDRTFT